MAVFAAGSPGFQGPTTVGTATSVKAWSGTVAALAGVSPAVTVRDITIVNTGTSSVYLVQGTIAPSATPNGLVLGAGDQITIQGWTATTGTSTTDISAICATGGGSSTVIAGLGTLVSVV